MPKHTAAPWAISRLASPDYAPQFGIYAESSPNTDLAIVRGDNAEADAALIHAAPDLLEAAKLADAALSEIYMATADTKQEGREHVASDQTLLRVRAAIAKAKGV